MARGRFFKPTKKATPSTRLDSGVCMERQVIDHSKTPRIKKVHIDKPEKVVIGYTYDLIDLYTTDPINIEGSSIRFLTPEGQEEDLFVSTETEESEILYEADSVVMTYDEMPFSVLSEDGEPEELLFKIIHINK